MARPGRPLELIVEAARRLNQKIEQRSPTTERAVFLAALTLFLVTTIVAYRALPGIGEHLDWLPIVIAGTVGVPLVIATNVGEYFVMLRFVDGSSTVLQAVRVTVASSAANLLPLPGAVLVRAQALKESGSTYKMAFSATFVVGLAWVSVTSVAVGTMALASHVLPAGAVVALGLGLGGVTLAIATALVGRDRTFRLAPALTLVELGWVLAMSLRFYLVLEGLGFDPSVTDATSLALAPAVASLSGFFPGGFGIRELLAAGIASVVGLPAAVGALASALDRVVALVVGSVLAVPFVWLRGRGSTRAGRTG